MTALKSSSQAYQLKDMQARSDDAYALAKYEIILDWIRPYPKMSVLNAGCGSGELCLMLASAGHEVVGIDANEEFIKIAKQSDPSNSGRCSFHAVSLEKFQSNSPFDAVIATDVLEHIEDDAGALKMMSSFLKPGGLILLTVPAGPRLFGFHDEMLGHFRRYTCGSLSDILKETAEQTNARYFGFFLIPACYWYSKLLRKPYPVAKSRQGAWFSGLLAALLWMEKMVKPPLGTSLLAMGRVRS